jgi:hypothetical protein
MTRSQKMYLVFFDIVKKCCHLSLVVKLTFLNTWSLQTRIIADSSGFGFAQSWLAFDKLITGNGYHYQQEY